MKTLITMTAIALTAITGKTSEAIPYTAMPIGIGYAVDVKGARAIRTRFACMTQFVRLTAKCARAAVRTTARIMKASNIPLLLSNDMPISRSTKSTLTSSLTMTVGVRGEMDPF